MAPRQMCGVLVIVLAILPSLVLATEFVVGDTAGWKPEFDYQAWAADKVFHVGDKLVFQYPEGVHNVIKVNGTGFQTCMPAPDNEVLTSGNDTIELKTAGNKWYICGKDVHCTKGQRLKITVLGAAESPGPSAAAPPPSTAAPPPSTAAPPPAAPSPNPGSSSGNGILASGYHAFMAVMAVIALMAMA